MPTGAQARRPVEFRTSVAAVEHLDELALTEGFVHSDGRPNRSDMIRNMLQYALRHRPKGWRP